MRVADVRRVTSVADARLARIARDVSRALKNQPLRPIR
jgi:hypothetical protein